MSETVLRDTWRQEHAFNAHSPPGTSRWMLILSRYMPVDAHCVPVRAGGCSFCPGTCRWMLIAGTPAQHPSQLPALRLGRIFQGALARVPPWGQMHPPRGPNLLCPAKFPPASPPDLGCPPLRHEVVPGSSPRGISGQGLTAKPDPGVTPAANPARPGAPGAGGRGGSLGAAPGPQPPPAQAGAAAESSARDPLDPRGCGQVPVVTRDSWGHCQRTQAVPGVTRPNAGQSVVGAGGAAGPGDTDLA